jgi:hypothetical protein
MSETAFRAFCEEAQWPREGGRFQAAAMEAWIAALEWAAGKVEAGGCQCAALGSDGDPEFEDGEHYGCCPIALVAAIREGR